MRVIAYGPSGFEEFHCADVARAAKLVGEKPTVWVNVDGQCTPEVLAAFETLFKLHPKALEDAQTTDQRVKSEVYPDHHFLVARMVTPAVEIETEQLALFLGKNFVVTFQEKQGGDCLEGVRDRLRKNKGKVRSSGADFLAYEILDAVVDGFFPALEAVEQRLDVVEQEIESDMMAPPAADTAPKLRDVKWNIATLRHAIAPTRETLHTFIRDAGDLVTAELKTIHLRDCYDHAVRIMERIEFIRDNCTDVRELYHARIGNYQNELSRKNNEVMKVIAILSAMLMPPTLIAGIYGMNFNSEKSPWNMPELNWDLGYPFALMLLAVSFLVPYFYFRWRGWLNKPTTRTRP